MNSATKGATVCALLLTERGDLNLDAPIAEVCPEFAARGKDRITLRMVMAHRAGWLTSRGSLQRTRVSGISYLPLLLRRRRAGNRAPLRAATPHLWGGSSARLSGASAAGPSAASSPTRWQLPSGSICGSDSPKKRSSDMRRSLSSIRECEHNYGLGRAGPASTGEYSAQHSLPARQSLRLCVRLSSGKLAAGRMWLPELPASGGHRGVEHSDAAVMVMLRSWRYRASGCVPGNLVAVAAALHRGGVEDLVVVEPEVGSGGKCPGDVLDQGTAARSRLL